MATTMTAIMKVMARALSDAGWTPVTVPSSATGPGYFHKSCRVDMSGDLEPMMSSGDVDRTTQTFAVELYESLINDPMLDEAQFIDDSFAAQSAINDAAYPAGTEYVAVESASFARDASEPSWGVIRLNVRVEWQAGG